MQSTKKPVQKVCTMCGETHDIAMFKRRLTLKQTQALLRRPEIRTATTLISSRCKYCWAQSKRKRPLSLKDIQNKKASGDLHAVKADLMLEEKRKAIPEKRSRVMKEYWEKRKTTPLKQLTLNLRQQVAQYKNRYHAYKSHVQKTCTDDNPNPNKDKQHALLRQHRLNYEQAQQIRNDLLTRAKSGEVIEVDVVIAKFFKQRSDANEMV